MRVEIAVAVGSITAAVTLILGFVAVRLQKTAPVMVAKSVEKIGRSEEYSVIGYEYLMILAAIVFILIFVYQIQKIIDKNLIHIHLKAPHMRKLSIFGQIS